MKISAILFVTTVLSLSCSNLFGQSETELFMKGKEFDKNKEYAKAVVIFGQLIELKPLTLDYYRWRSDELVKLHHYSEALKDMNIAIQKSADIEPSDYLRRGQIYYALLNYETALADLNTAIKLDKSKFFFFTWRAYTYARLKQYDNAILDLNTAAELDATKDFVFSRRGEYKLQKKDYLGAITDLQKAIGLNLNNSGAYLTLGVCYYQLQKYDLAHENYQKAYNINPSNANLANLSLGIARLGRTTEALQNLDKVLAAFSTDTTLKNPGYYYYMKARVYGFNNMKTECMNSLNQAFKFGLDSKSNFSFESYFNELTPIHLEPEFLALIKQYNMAVPADFNNALATNTFAKNVATPIQPVIASIGSTDVDQNIPVINKQNPYCFALIIGNEDYSSFQRDLNSEVNVEFASRDASIFKEYAIKTMGIPNDNVIFLLNAKSIEMDRALRQITLLCKNANGKAEIIFYYAGHGFPDEVSKEPYLIPVDVSASDLKYAFKLADIYKQFTLYPSKKVTVFLDACFSGGARNQGLIAARGIKIKPKENMLSGNLVVFSASSGDQSALPFKDKKHGMFTYFLLKKLKESEGKLTYKELSDYISEQVGLSSVLVNKKEQNAQTNASVNIVNSWGNWGF